MAGPMYVSELLENGSLGEEGAECTGAVGGDDGQIGLEDEEEQFRHRWSDVNDTAARPTAHAATCVSLSMPLLPNCLALIFKHNCSFQHQMGPSSAFAPATGPRGAGNHRYVPPALTRDEILRTKMAAHLQLHQCRVIPPADLGYRLFWSFRDINRKYLFWHKDLSRCLRRLEFVGFIQPCTVLVTTTSEDWLDILKRCWSQQLLVSPPSYSLEMLAEVHGCSMFSVCQSAAVNLIDAICGVICDLAFTSLPSTLDVIFAAVSNKYAACGADIPPIAVFNDMLAFLVAKRRVILHPNGNYRMAPKESYSHRHHRHRRDQLQQQQLQRVQPNFSSLQGPSIVVGEHVNEQQTVDGTNKPHVSIFRKLFRRRFFGRAKSRDSTPPPGLLSHHHQQVEDPHYIPYRSVERVEIANAATNNMNMRPSHSTAMPSRTLPVVERPPGLFDACVNTGAVPSLTCSTNTVSEHVLRRWPAANVNTSQPVAGTRFSSNNDPGIASNFSINAATRPTAPFSTPTSAYLSSGNIEDQQQKPVVLANFLHNESGGSLLSLQAREQSFLGMCDEGYEGLASGCADIQVAADEEEEEEEEGEEEDETAGARGPFPGADNLGDIDIHSVSSSSSSWSSTPVRELRSNKPTPPSTHHDSPQSGGERASANVEINNSSDTINATCAKIVSAELDSLIERYRSSVKTDNNTESPAVSAAPNAKNGEATSDSSTKSTKNSSSCNNDNHSASNSNDCPSRASTGTLFSVADFMIYSASLTVDNHGDLEIEEGEESKLITKTNNDSGCSIEVTPPSLISGPMIYNTNHAVSCDSMNLAGDEASVAEPPRSRKASAQFFSIVKSSTNETGNADTADDDVLRNPQPVLQDCEDYENVLKTDAGQAIFGA